MLINKIIQINLVYDAYYWASSRKRKVKNKGFIGRGMMTGISALGKLIGRTLATQSFYAKWAKFNNITKLPGCVSTILPLSFEPILLFPNSPHTNPNGDLQ